MNLEINLVLTFETFDEIYSNIDKGKIVTTAFVDLATEFDTVDLKILLICSRA